MAAAKKQTDGLARSAAKEKQQAGHITLSKRRGGGWWL